MRLISIFKALFAPNASHSKTEIHNETNNQVSQYSEISDSTKEFEYHATMQLRTPLKVLLKHGSIYSGNNPPGDNGELWHGVWIQKTKTFREMGIDLDEFPSFEHASDIGQVKPEEYFPFLIEVRRAVESTGDISEKIDRLRAVLRDQKFTKFVRRHGGQGTITDYFFPPILSEIPGINSTVTTALREARINTVAKLKKKTDKELLALKGVGPGALQKLRAFAKDYDGDERAERREAEALGTDTGADNVSDMMQQCKSCGIYCFGSFTDCPSCGTSQ